ncbi:unnamed protein product [Hydatigera taeniaeformis]|uniref:Uncharacterized protein n=1 Tax=Hydatigena taeniaeformis TaxID=6205 RepID=A0A3P7FFE6_HYDTA|nr:unnamed protein product [Hydatigera taeniaeformis]
MPYNLAGGTITEKRVSEKSWSAVCHVRHQEEDEDDEDLQQNNRVASILSRWADSHYLDSTSTGRGSAMTALLSATQCQRTKSSKTTPHLNSMKSLPTFTYLFLPFAFASYSALTPDAEIDQAAEGTETDLSDTTELLDGEEEDKDVKLDEV